MKEEKNNRQFQETHSRIMNTFICLLSRQALSRITVKQICETLSVNRSTFYEHFTDIYDLVEQTEKEMSKEGAVSFLNGLKLSRADAFKSFFQYVEDNQTFYKVYLEQGKIIHFSAEMMGEGMDERKKNIARLKWGDSSAHEDYHIEFFRAGINALIRLWIERKCRETPEELYLILVEEYKPLHRDLT